MATIEPPNLYDLNDVDLDNPDYEHLKYDIGLVWIRLSDSVVKAEIKVVTIIDLLTKVAGIPSFLFIIYQYGLKHFERFYSDVQIYSSFQGYSKSKKS